MKLCSVFTRQSLWYTCVTVLVLPCALFRNHTQEQLERFTSDNNNNNNNKKINNNNNDNDNDNDNKKINEKNK